MKYYKDGSPAECTCGSKEFNVENEQYEECFGYILSEYDMICAKCGKLGNHWAYGCFEIEPDMESVVE